MSLSPYWIIAAAIEAGIGDKDLSDSVKCICVSDYGDISQEVLRFAEMIAEKEREACAKVCETSCLRSKNASEYNAVCMKMSNSIRARSMP